MSAPPILTKTLRMHNSISLYIHWPFCVSKCPYCDFFSVVNTSFPENALQTYLQELRRHRGILGPRELKSVFFGGGTPSLMPLDFMESLLKEAFHYFPPKDDIEISLEANPHVFEKNKFHEFRALGVNRLSLGVQSFRDDYLRFLGREHTTQEALRVIEHAQKVFDRVSFDLIYALPNQTLADWEDDLRLALSLGTQHLSLYQLTIEAGTRFFQSHERGDFKIPCQDTAADFYERTWSIVPSSGLKLYEVSNYAKPGEECRHNLAYWRYDDYIGIGPGAHGRYQISSHTPKIATHYPRNLQGWGDGETLEISTTQLRQDDMQTERLMMSLRLAEGIPLPYVAFLPQDRLEILETEGLAHRSSTHWALTLSGLMKHGKIVAFLNP